MISAPLTLAQKQARAAKLEPYEMRLRELRRAAKGAHAALSGLIGERLALHQERQDLARYIAQWGVDLQRNPRVPGTPEDPKLAGARIDLKMVEQRLAELETAIESAQAAWKPQIKLLTACEEWLEDNTGRIANG
ncbi:hypothetical protein [Thiocapsa sp. UBA6158]|jgi:outer membrane protein TolC|uniref:hypothetical protein n=1 Tax=Thiocapsa sp. UBA6158 TaxID=1947692 RepID=UPI0025FBDCDF|nr:hypothetical protein [Thiocapsa sp. UBA6158]